MERILRWPKARVGRKGQVFLAVMIAAAIFALNLTTDVAIFDNIGQYLKKEFSHRTFLNTHRLEQSLEYKYSKLITWNPNLVRLEIPDQIRNFCNAVGLSRPGLIPDCYTSMRPRLWLGKQRNASVQLVLGMPTILRPVKQYVKTTMKKLLRELSPPYRNSTLILVLLADEKYSNVQKLLRLFFEHFGEEIHSGLMEIIVPNQSFYKTLETFPCPMEDRIQSGDAKLPCKSQYIRWRNKQNFDYAYLMAYGSQLGEYYLQMEDDMMCGQELFPAVFGSIKNYKNNPWVLAEATGRGFRGKMFRSNDTFHLAQFLLQHFEEQPCDWLYETFVNAQPNPCQAEPEKYPLASTDCRQGSRKLLLRNHDICYHRGRFSSLKGKVVPVHLEII